MKTLLWPKAESEEIEFYQTFKSEGGECRGPEVTEVWPGHLTGESEVGVWYRSQTGIC